MSKWVVPVNIALALLIVASLAHIASDLISLKLTRTFAKVSQKKSTAPSPAVQSDDLSSYAPILAKGLFGKATQGQLTPIAQGVEKKSATTSQSDLLLLGTALGSFRETFALIRKTSTNEERVFRLGDQVFDIGSLVAVKKEQVDVKSGGQVIKIQTPAMGAEGEKPGGQSPPGATGGLASQVGAGSYVVDQRALKAALDNIGQAMTDARLLPSMKDGKVEGFKASEVKPAGIFGMVGIKNGDVLVRINEFTIDSPEKAIQSLASLKGQSRIKLDLIRDGQPATFSYDIR